MTHSVVVTDNIFDAILWCDKNVGRNKYNIDNQFPSWRWQFRFNDIKDATLFALKWS